MAAGKGKYDDALTVALSSVGAVTGILLVQNGMQGAGFSIQATQEELIALPDVLEQMAKEIRKDNKKRFN